MLTIKSVAYCYACQLDGRLLILWFYLMPCFYGGKRGRAKDGVQHCHVLYIFIKKGIIQITTPSYIVHSKKVNRITSHSCIDISVLSSH